MNAVMSFFDVAQGCNSTVIGPFIVFGDLGEKFDGIAVGQHGMEDVGPEQKTDPHTHDFPSFYKSKNLNVVSEGKTYQLPAEAVVLVLPGVDHSWVAQGATIGAVGSIDNRHEKQIVVAEAVVFTLPTVAQGVAGGAVS